MNGQIHFRTAQNVEISFEPANLGDRIVAYLLDALFIAAYAIAVILIMLAIASDDLGWLYALLLGPIPFYHLIFEIFNEGQTPGKKIKEIKVVKLDGSAPSIGAYLLRWIFRIIDFSLASGVVAVICVASTERRQRVGDMVANTTVIKLARTTSLKDTIFTAVEEGRAVQFPQVRSLGYKDIETIKEVLNSDFDQRPVLMYKTAAKLMDLLEIRTTLKPKPFLETLVKDYNIINNIEDF